MGRLQRHSEACFVNDLLRDAADRLATSKSSAEEVERGAPSTESDPVEARELSRWFFSVRFVLTTEVLAKETGVYFHHGLNDGLCSYDCM